MKKNNKLVSLAITALAVLAMTGCSLRRTSNAGTSSNGNDLTSVWAPGEADSSVSSTAKQSSNETKTSPVSSKDPESSAPASSVISSSPDSSTVASSDVSSKDSSVSSSAPESSVVSSDDRESSSDVTSSSGSESSTVISSSETSSSDERESSSEESSTVPVENVDPTYKKLEVTDGLTPSSDTHTVADNDIEKIVSLPEVAAEDKADYFVSANSSFTLALVLDNPSKATITSVTINDVVYSNDQLTVTSTGVSISMTSSDTPGYQDYKITKYAYTFPDGTVGATEIEEKIVVATAYTSAPTAEIVESHVHPDSITLSINVTDKDNLIGENALKVYITDGKTEIGSKDLTVGSNAVTFDGLSFDTSYQVGVATAFDLLDGNKNHSLWLVKDSYKTPNVYSFDKLTSTKTTVSYELASEIEEGANISSVVLYDGTTEVATATDTSYTFADLLSNHEYSVVVNFVYADKSYNISQDIKTLAMVAPKIANNGVTVTKDSLSYAFTVTDEDELMVIDSVEVYDSNKKVVATVEDNALTGTVDGLLSDNAYSVRVSYHYDLNDGKGKVSNTLTANCTTEKMIAPTVEMTLYSDEISIDYELTTTDVDNILSIDEVILKHGDDVISTSEGANGTSFVGLYSDESYDVTVNYSYDLNDGKGVHSETITKSKKTSAMTAPTVSFDDPSIGKDFISGNISVTQNYDITTIEEINLYEADSGKLISTQTGSSYNFTDLDSITNYKIELKYKYNLNTIDGKEEEKTLTKTVKTWYDFTFYDLQCTNSSDIIEEDYIFLTAYYTSPKDMELKIEGVDIDGEYFDNTVFNTSSNKMQFNVDTSNYQIVGGETTVTVEKLYLIDAKDNEEYTVNLNEDNTVTVKVHGKCEVNDIYFGDENNNLKDYFTPEEDVYVYLDVYDKTGYTITSIKTSSLGTTTKLEKINQNLYRYKYNNTESTQGFITEQVTKINYKSDAENDDYTDTLDFYNRTARGFFVNDATVYSVSTIGELTAMQDYKIYKLTDDLDFSGYNTMNDKTKKYTGTDFNGVLLGDGHAVKNFTLNDNYNNQTQVNIGLFTSGNVIIQDLKLEEMNYDVVLKNRAGDTTSCNANIGGFIATTTGSVIRNCSVDSTSLFTLINETPYNSVVNQVDIGAFAGYMDGNSSIINCYNAGNVMGNNAGYAGGFVGKMTGSIRNSYNVGSVKLQGGDNVGAFAGYFYVSGNGDQQIENSINLGPDKLYSKTISLFKNTSTKGVKNSYNLFNLYTSNDKRDGVTSIKRIDVTSDFFKDTLGWDEDVWDLTKVDSDKRIYPTLKY